MNFGTSEVSSAGVKVVATSSEMNKTDIAY